MVRTLLQALVALALAALWARVVGLPASEARRTAEPAITYPRLRHLVVGTVFLVLALWLALWFASRVQEVLTLLAISMVLAVALRPTIDWMDSARLPVIDRAMPRALAILLIYLVLLIATAGIGFLAVPPIVAEVERLITNLPDLFTHLETALRGLQRYPFVPDLSALMSQLLSQLLGDLSQAVNVLLFAVGIVTGILSGGLVLVFTFFLLYDARLIHEHFASLLPPSQQESARAISARMGRKIEGWLKGSLLLGFILGSVTALAMWLLDMPYPLLLGVAAGVFELIPFLGPYLGAAPAVGIALFSQPPWKLIVVVLFFFAAQQIENNVLAPHIMSRQVELPPLLVILALLLGGALYGIIGALLAVPAAAVLQVLWTDLVVPEIRRRHPRS